MEPSDEVLCQRVAHRDEAAFDLLVGRYQGRAYRVAWSILRDAEEARDLSQEAFIRLHEVAGSFAGRSRFSTWFYRILVNLCLDHRRKRRWWRRILAPATLADEPGIPVLDRQSGPFRDPVDELAEEHTLRQLWAAVGSLSPRQRTVVLLQVQEGLPTGEIAAILNCSEATVRVHLHRALVALRKLLKRE